MATPAKKIIQFIDSGNKLTATEKAYIYYSKNKKSQAPSYTKIVCSKTGQVRFDPSKPRKRILYNSHLINSAKKKEVPVYLCGSEKWADLLFEKHGAKVATTTIDGIKDGKNAWRPAYTKALSGVDVVVIYKEEERKGALEIVHELLTNGEVTTLSSVEINSLDISKEELERRIAQATQRSLPENYPDWNCSDSGNGQRLAFWADGNHRYLWDSKSFKHPTGWYSFNGKVWKNSLEELESLANEVIRNISLEVANSDNPDRQKALEKHAKNSQQTHKKKNMITEARSMAGMDIQANKFDNKKGILNVSNGTIDLRTGELLPFEREDYLTAISATRYDPEARAERWESFIGEICAGDAELMHFLQVLFGYIITGEVSLRHFVILQGNGNNGKTTLVETIASVLGDQYSTPIPSNTYYGKTRTGSPDAVLASLKVFRLVYGSEGEPEERLATSKCKLISGKDKTSARPPHEKYSEIYDPQFTPLLLTNPLPTIDDNTNAFWGRLILIPFRRDFRAEGLDKNLAEDLAKERSGILNWLVEGAKLFYEDEKSLPPCSAVEEAIASYRTDEDVLERFIQEECIINDDATCTAKQLTCTAKQFLARFNRDRAPGEQWDYRHLKAKMGEKGYNSRISTGNKTYYYGIDLKK